MQLGGTHGGDRRADRGGKPHLAGHRRRRPDRRVDPAAPAQAPVRTMTVVVIDIDPKHLLQVPSPDDQQPVKTLGPDRPDPSLREGVRVGRLHRGDQHLGPVRAEHIIKATGELRVTVAEHKAQSSPSLVEYQEQVPGLLGDPGTIWVGRYPGQVDPAGCPVR